MKKEILNQNQTLFCAYIRPPSLKTVDNKNSSKKTLNLTTNGSSLKNLPSQPHKSPFKYEDSFPYSCFSNKDNTKVFLTTQPLSGNLLSRSLMKEEINTSRKLLNEFTTESYDFDYVLQAQTLEEETIKALTQNFIGGKSTNIFLYGAKRFFD